VHGGPLAAARAVFAPLAAGRGRRPWRAGRTCRTRRAVGRVRAAAGARTRGASPPVGSSGGAAWRSGAVPTKPHRP